MKLMLFVCYMLCCATLVSTAKPTWEKIQKQLKKSIKSYTDLVHVVSSHQQVTQNDFDDAKEAAKFLTQSVQILASPIGRWYSKIGFVQFSTNTYHEFGLGWTQSLSIAENRIDNVPRRTGNHAAVGSGLNYAKGQLNYYSSWCQHRVVWLVTNRFSEIGFNAEFEANQLKNMGVKVFIVAIGDINRWKELRDLASSKAFFFQFDSYTEYKQAVLDAKNSL